MDFFSPTDVNFTKYSTSTVDKIPIIFYSLEGFIIMIVNLFIFVRIIIIKNLRTQKEFIIMGACVFLDFVFGATYLSAGLRRAIIVLQYDFVPMATHWDCFISPSVQLFILITPAVGYILVLTALDRLYCVFLPFSYIKTPVYYGYAILILPILLSIPTYVLSFFDAEENNTDFEHTMICMMIQGTSPQNYAIMRSIRIFCCLIVIPIYIPIIVKVYMLGRNHSLHSAISSQNQRRLIKLTLTIALMTVNTLLLFTIPDIILYFQPRPPTFSFYLLNLNKGIANLIVLFWTQKPMRRLLYKSGDRINVTTVVMQTPQRIFFPSNRASSISKSNNRIAF